MKYGEDKYTAYINDDTFTAVEMASIMFTDIPTGFCDDSVYEALADARTALSEFNDSVGFKEWLQNDQDMNLLDFVE